jgi:hypothetical protein
LRPASGVTKAAPPNGDKLSGGACRPRSRLGGGRTRRPVPMGRTNRVMKPPIEPTNADRHVKLTFETLPEQVR